MLKLSFFNQGTVQEPECGAINQMGRHWINISRGVTHSLNRYLRVRNDRKIHVPRLNAHSYADGEGKRKNK